jgi:hypothetical protein
MFAMTSRYATLPLRTFTRGDGTQVSYVARRMLPQPGQYALLLLHTVTDSDRLDNLTARYLDDPKQFWRICDGNTAMSPFELTEAPGSTIRITVTLAISGPRRA